MKVFEIVLAGFNGATDETDHLVKWIQAPSEEAVSKYVQASGLRLHGFHNKPQIVDLSGWEFSGVGLDIDLELDAEGKVLQGELGKV